MQAPNYRLTPTADLGAMDQSRGFIGEVLNEFGDQDRSIDVNEW